MADNARLEIELNYRTENDSFDGTYQFDYNEKIDAKPGELIR